MPGSSAVHRSLQAATTLSLPSNKVSSHYRVEITTNWLHVRRNAAKISTYISYSNISKVMATSTSRSAKRISNSFLSTSNESKRIWLIILNYLLPPETRSIWGRAFERICADGGANRVFDFFPEAQSSAGAPKGTELQKPSIILGDLDSLSAAVRMHYEQQGVPCSDLSYDQDSTDLDKCLAYVQSRQAEERRKRGQKEEQQDLVVVVGALGGRLDHTLGNLNSLYTHPDQQIVLLGEGNVVRLLQRGETHIHVDREVEDELELKFGGMISACNHVDRANIEIKCSGPCLWISTTKDDD